MCVSFIVCLNTDHKSHSSQTEVASLINIAKWGFLQTLKTLRGRALSLFKSSPFCTTHTLNLVFLNISFKGNLTGFLLNFRRKNKNPNGLLLMFLLLHPSVYSKSPNNFGKKQSLVRIYYHNLIS